MQHTITNIREALTNIYTESEVSIFVRLIIEDSTGLPISVFLSDKNTKITEAQELKIDKIIERLLRFEPIQYILGETEFFGLRFLVNSNVLIPRPETEELVERIITDNSNTQLNILDIGTGSGCIAVSLKKHLKQATITGWDISKEALETATSNARLNSVNVCFLQVDVLSKYPVETFDIIVSNPPYILESEKHEMDNNVLDYEPHTALFISDQNPLLFYERIADIAIKLLKPNGKLYFEINRSKGIETMEMLVSKDFIKVELIKDISGNDRIVKAICPKA